jgi:hypothetical protein
VGVKVQLLIVFSKHISNACFDRTKALEHQKQKSSAKKDVNSLHCSMNTEYRIPYTILRIPTELLLLTLKISFNTSKASLINVLSTKLIIKRAHLLFTQNDISINEKFFKINEFKRLWTMTAIKSIFGTHNKTFYKLFKNLRQE